MSVFHVPRRESNSPKAKTPAGRAPHDSACRPRGKPTISPMKAAGVASPPQSRLSDHGRPEQKDEGADVHPPSPDRAPSSHGEAGAARAESAMTGSITAS